MKVGINLSARAHFGGVSTGAKAMSVGFLLRRTIADPRIQNATNVGGEWVSHVLKVSGPEEVDEQLLDWLAEAYAAKA